MSHLNRLRSSLGAMAQMAAAGMAPPRLAIVSSYDPNTYAVKVKLQPTPEDGNELETGWLPIWSPWIGNQWGLYCPPQVNDQVLVVFQEGDVDRGVCIGGLFSDVDVPLSVPDKEFWLVHEQGAFLKFTNDGKVSLTAPSGFFVTGDTTITGQLHVTKDVNCDQTVTATTDVVGGGKHLKTHTHSDPQGGSTGQPN